MLLDGPVPERLEIRAFVLVDGQAGILVIGAGLDAFLDEGHGAKDVVVELIDVLRVALVV